MIFKSILFFGLLLADSLVCAVDSGNWYEKMQWWKKAKPLYQSIKDRNLEIQALKEELVKSQKRVVSYIDELYKRARINKPETMNVLNNYIESKTDFSEEEILDKLEKLKASLQEIFEMEKQSKEAYKIIDQQLSMANHYQDKSLQAFEDIEAVYDDRQARSYYEVIENSKENLDLILTYLNHQLRMFLNTLYGKVQSLGSSSEQLINYLEDEGLEVKYYTQEEKDAKEKARLEEEQEKERLKKIELERIAKENEPWYKKFFNKFFYTVINFFKKLFRLS